VGNSTHLNPVLAAIEGFIVEGQLGPKDGQLFFNFTALGVNVVIVYNFGVGGPVVQLVCGFGQGVELVPRGREEVAEPDLNGLGCG